MVWMVPAAPSTPLRALSTVVVSAAFCCPASWAVAPCVTHSHGELGLVGVDGNRGAADRLDGARPRSAPAARGRERQPDQKR